MLRGLVGFQPLSFKKLANSFSRVVPGAVSEIFLLSLIGDPSILQVLLRNLR
jgi:hypothetical protein